MTNLDRVCLFSNLIIIPVHSSFFTGLVFRIYWKMIKFSKRAVILKRGRTKYQGGNGFFSFINQNFCHILFLFLHILHLKRDPKDEFIECLAVLNTMT